MNHPTNTIDQDARLAYEAYMGVLDLSFPMDFDALPDTYIRAWRAAVWALRIYNTEGSDRDA